MKERNRKTGLDVLHSVSWGTHFCAFYKTKKDLMDILIPYFTTGLQGNEYCIWVASGLLDKKETEILISEKMPDLRSYLEKKQIEIVSYSDWYFTDSIFDLEKAIENLNNRLSQALALGFEGLRIAGDMSWSGRKHIENLCSYEEYLNKDIFKNKILAACTYSLDHCHVNQALDIIVNHRFALIRSDGCLEKVINFENKRMDKNFRKSVVRSYAGRRHAEAVFKTLFNQLPISIYLIKNGKFGFVNQVFLRETGYQESELLNSDALNLVYPKDRKEVRENAVKTLKGERIFPYKYRYMTKNKELRWRVETVTPIYCKGMKILLCTSMDVTEVKDTEKQLEYLSLHDSLTGLYNRAYFEEEMRRFGEGRFSSIGIITSDIDGLKFINDKLGHNYGDKLLVAASQLIKNAFRIGDVVARVGGDEFAVLLPDCSDEIVKSACSRVKNNIEAYNEKNAQLPLSISMGFAVGKSSPGSLRNLFREAENNMGREKLHRSRSARSSIVQALMKTLEVRDFITEDHAKRMEDLVTGLAEIFSMADYQVTDLRLLAQFHDIGKVGISDSILFKPGPLTEEEITSMRQHTAIGHQIALSLPELVPIADWILKHHEWWNGKGYPLGLVGQEIPVECRILAVVDAYDAMTNDRPYRKALRREDALMELRKYAGIQFDPIVVDCFQRLLEN
ncbi:MAG: MEDS domain-containing protein [Eubacteriales bacterium]|jgi:diguanylate cyclase (GGDEF)-like protein/PAS domain S-box-containing protein